MRKICGISVLNWKRIGIIIALYICFLKAGQYFVPKSSYVSQTAWMKGVLKGVDNTMNSGSDTNHMAVVDSSHRMLGLDALLSQMDEVKPGKSDVELKAYIPESKLKSAPQAPAKSQAPPVARTEPQTPHAPSAPQAPVDPPNSTPPKAAAAAAPPPPKEVPEKAAEEDDTQQAAPASSQSPSNQEQPIQTASKSKSNLPKSVNPSAPNAPVLSRKSIDIPLEGAGRHMPMKASEHLDMSAIRSFFIKTPPVCNPKVCTQTQRKTRMEEKCSELLNTPYGAVPKGVNIYRRIMVDDKNRLLYCVYPAAASMSMINTLYLAVTGKRPAKDFRFKDLEKAGLKFLSTFPEGHQKTKLENYHKILVTRHPFDRLVSSWNMKLAAHRKTAFYEGKAPSILALAGKNNSTEYENGISFKDFLDYIVYTDLVQPGKHADHWDSNMNLCHPCHIKYDSILKVETFGVDSRDFLPRLNLNKIPVVNRHRKLSGRELMMQKILPEFQGINMNIVRYLLQMYKADFELFGYKWLFEKNQAMCTAGPCSNTEPCC